MAVTVMVTSDPEGLKPLADVQLCLWRLAISSHCFKCSTELTAIIQPESPRPPVRVSERNLNHDHHGSFGLPLSSSRQDSPGEKVIQNV
jgi:hypothetical protein